MEEGLTAMKIMKKISIFLVTCFFCSFVYSQEFTINVPSETPKNRPVLSHCFSSIHYLPLETTEDCLIGGKYELIITDEYIIVNSNKNCFLFDLETGYFIRAIGHFGNDPEGFQSTSSSFYNPSNKTIYFTGWNDELIKYSLDGKYQGKIKIPLQRDDFSSPSFASLFTTIDDSTLCAYFSNLNGKEQKKLVLFKENGEIESIYKNTNIIDYKGISFQTNDALFYKYNNKHYFKEMYVDTIFMVSKSNLSPQYTIDLSHFVPKYKDRYNSKKEFRYGDLFEDKRFIYFDYGFEIKSLILYSKDEKKASFYKYDQGFIDDINHFLPITLKCISDDGSLIGTLPAFDVNSEMELEKNKKNPTLRNLQTVSPEDNPVIVILKSDT